MPEPLPSVVSRRRNAAVMTKFLAFSSSVAVTFPSINFFTSLRSEVKKLIDGNVTATELEKAKNFVITAALRRRETTLGKGSGIRDPVIYHDDASYGNRGLDRLQAVTASDAQRVAKKYLAGKPVVITYTAGGAK